MSQFGLANAENIEPYFKQPFMVKNIPSIKDKGRFCHGLVNLLIIEIPIYIPLSHNSYCIAASSRLIRICYKAYFSVYPLQVDPGIPQGLWVSNY